MLAALRSRAGGLFSKTLLGLLVLSFAVWGIGDIFRLSSSRPLAKVGGEPISQNEFRTALEREQENLRRSLGNQYSQEMLKALGLHRQLLEKLITEKLINHESEDAGLRVDEKHVAEKIIKNPLFSNSAGKFDKSQYLSALQIMRVSEAQYTANLKHDIAAELLTHAVSRAAPLEESLPEQLHSSQQQKRAVEVMEFSADTIKKANSPGDEELESLQRKYAAEFSTPEYREFTYLLLDGRKLPGSGDAQDKAINAARRLEDELAGGATLEEAAASLKLEARKAGPLSLQQKTPEGKKADLPSHIATLLPDIFLLGDGEESQLSLSKNGIYHILRVDRIIPSTLKPLDEVRPALLKHWEKAYNEERLQEMVKKAMEELSQGKSPEEVADRYHARFASAGNMKLDGTGASRELPDALRAEIFRAPLKTWSQPYPLSSSQMMIARAVRIQKTADTASKDEAAKLRKKLMEDKHYEMQEEYILYLRNKHGVSINEAALEELAQ